jgi:methionine-rich copper-binding protein CopC
MITRARRRRALSAVLAAAAAAAAVGRPLPSWANPPQPIESRPAAEAILDGRTAEYVVRFDRPVDHERSRLFILRDGRTVAELRPSLDSEPEVLFAEAPALPPGTYELRWVVRSPSGEEVGEGSVPFRVRR